MRFNKQELITLATQPSNKFEKEGLLYITERQEGFFRRTEERTGDLKSNAAKTTKNKLPKRTNTFSCIGGTAKVSTERWCRLRGNLLFYLKTNDQFSEAQGVIVLEKYKVVIHNEKREHDGFVFFLEFDDGLKQRLASNTELERTEWIKIIRLASYGVMRTQLQYLREQIEKKRGAIQDIDVDMLRLQNGKEIDITEIPICESAISCDNLLCDGHGRPPNPSVVVQVTAQNRAGWIKYGRTEVIEKCSNPQFLCTITFRCCDGLNIGSQIRFTAYDVREKISQTAVPLGSAEIALGVIQDTTRLRIPLRSNNGNAGFITIATWVPETDKKTPRSPAKVVEQQNIGHRRSQSLPPKLGVKLFVPSQGRLSLLFSNPNVHTYRLHSGLGGDISVQEIMMESQLCFLIPQQLLSIYILREKELLQEISGMGELGGQWRNKQMDLLDKHLKLLKDYSQAKQNLQQCNGTYFKQSIRKDDEALEFAPVNLHLQRMFAHNDTLKRSGYLDVVTVGAFTRHTGKSKTGGLIKLLHQIKDSPSKMDQQGCKVQTANDAVQAIKQLRKEIVEIMSQLLFLAKSKNPKGMLTLCNDMMTKTRSLLNIWEPNLVEEAFEFIERHRIIDEPDNNLMPMSPFKKITQQLGALDLKSPELEDFATPMGPAPDLWPQLKGNRYTIPTSSSIPYSTNISNLKTKSPSATDINAISTIQNTVKSFNQSSSNMIFAMQNKTKIHSSNDMLSCSLPVTCNLGLTNEFDGLKFNETHFDVNGEISTSCSSNKDSLIDDTSFPTTINDLLSDNIQSQSYPFLLKKKSIEDIHKSESNLLNNSSGASSLQNHLIESRNEILLNSNQFDENGYPIENPSIILGYNGAFLDTKVMSSSPSANYYRPTEEPEPLDLTQLNIEASVMCLVSKVKFLCGRCGSPAVRLRQPKSTIKRGFNCQQPDVVTSQPISTTQDHDCSIASSYNSTTITTPVNTTAPASIVTTASGQISTENSCATSIKSSKDLNLALTQAVGEVARKVKKGNKFTDGLDLSLTTDWASELRPSMRKLRQAMDGLLKTARLMHSVQRLQQDMKKITSALTIMYRRDVCFSQALTSLITGLMTKLWGTVVTENYINILCNLGPLAYFEGLLSLYGQETDMWGDMSVAIEDLSTVNFTLVRSNINRDTNSLPLPRLIGSRQSINVLLPIPDNIYCLLPTKNQIQFKVTPVFFNIGINEKATISEALGHTREQHRSNWDNFDRLKQYHIRYKKLTFQFTDNSLGLTLKQSLIATTSVTNNNNSDNVNANITINQLNIMEDLLRLNTTKNIRILHIAEDICRNLHGIRFTSCKSAKDRTSMAVTLEQCRLLQQEFHLPSTNVPTILNTMRSEGTRSDNTMKNIGLKKYAFNLPQVLSLPTMYRPPAGSYGKAQT